MASLLVLVFVLQLLAHLFESVGTHALNEFLWVIWNKLPTPTSGSVQRCNQLRLETLQLKRQMNATSAQDDFAKWAKLRRQHDKSMAEHEKASSSLDSAKSRFTTVANALRWILTTGMRLVLFFWYSREPIYWVPQGWLPSYIEWLIACPKAPMGSVSIVTWNFACHSVITVLAEMFTATWALVTGNNKLGSAAPDAARKQAHAFPAAAGSEKKKKK